MTLSDLPERIGAESVIPDVGSEWFGWLMENERRGCSPESMAAAMISAGLDREAANAALRAVRGGGEQVVIDRAVAQLDDTYHHDQCPVPGGTTIRAHNRDVAVLLRSDSPQIVLFDEVLSPEECDRLIELARPHGSKDGVRLARSDDPLVAVLDRRLSVLMGSPAEQGEDLLVRRHRIGDECSPTFDYFPPNDPMHQRAAGGQRAATLLIWLNDDVEGGELRFPEVGLTVAPNRGGAVYFRYFNAWGQVDGLTLHNDVPVTNGELWTVTKWMRQYRLR